MTHPVADGDVPRMVPDDDAAELLALTRRIADAELAPRVAADEASGTFPRDVVRTLGRAGLLGLPYPTEYGGGGQPYLVYLQVLEELAARWLAVALGVSVHTLACYPLATAGSARQRERWLPDLLGGDLLGGYCLSEPASGSDAAAMRTRAVPRPAAGGEPAGYRVDGTKAWITHAGVADFYTLFARTSGDPDAPDRSHGISCFHVPADTAGVAAAPVEHKMGMNASPTAQMLFTGAELAAGQRIGEEGRGFSIALSALDAGRLGIAACSVGVAQAALNIAVRHAAGRRQFGRPVIEFEGLGFLLADMATRVEASRALYLRAARLRDAGLPFGRQAAMAKLQATDTAMRVATDAVQVLGGIGYTEDYPAARYLREAKVLQIVEGTNQVQRLVIARHLARDGSRNTPESATAG